MKRIAVEEHFLTKDFVEYLYSRTDYPRRKIVADAGQETKDYQYYSEYCTAVFHGSVLSDMLFDLGKGRLSSMDKAGIDMQVLSLSIPGVEPLPVEDGVMWSKRINDELAHIVKSHPGRFIGLAALPMQEPEAASAELERAVKLGLKGANILSHVQGEYLDNEKFWVIFETAEKLDVPIYIHPREPVPQIAQLMVKYASMWSALWGFGADVGLHAALLICSGVFDRYPNLKIMLGHMGEALPFWRWRMDNHWKRGQLAKQVSLMPSDYMKNNFYFTTSGMFFEPALLCALLSIGADNILFAADYPYETNEEAVRFMDTAGISPTDKEKIYHLNAEKLFKIDKIE